MLFVAIVTKADHGSSLLSHFNPITNFTTCLREVCCERFTVIPPYKGKVKIHPRTGHEDSEGE